MHSRYPTVLGPTAIMPLPVRHTSNLTKCLILFIILVLVEHSENGQHMLPVAASQLCVEPALHSQDLVRAFIHIKARLLDVGNLLLHLDRILLAVRVQLASKLLKLLEKDRVLGRKRRAVAAL